MHHHQQTVVLEKARTSQLSPVDATAQVYHTGESRREENSNQKCHAVRTVHVQSNAY